MNALYLTYDGLTDALGQSQVIPYIVGLQKKGINFTIISFEKEKAYTSQKVIQQILDEHQIKWIPLNYNKKPPILSTVVDIIHLKKQLKKIIQSEEINLIHCRSYITSLIGLWAKKNFNIPFIFDMRGFWADERVDGKIWNLNNFIFKKVYNYFKNKEREFIKEAYHIVSLTKAGKAEIESWKIKNSPITIIPCCTDEQLFNSKKVKDIRSKLNISSNEFVISYLGSIGTWYMLDEMLDFFKVILKTIPNAKFLFITKDDKNFILNKAEEKNIDIQSLIITASERGMIPSYIALSNFSIFFIKPLYSKKASSPTKMGEVMNLGIPIICNKGVGDVDTVMKEVDNNLIVNDFSDKEYERIANYVINYNADTKKIIETSHHYYSLEKGIDSYFKIYNQLVEKK